MKLIVFGASGASGRLVVESALAAGHVVTAFVRDAKRLPHSHPCLHRIEGDAMDASAVAAAVPGHDAVLCALGTMPDSSADSGRRQPGVPVCSEGTKNMLAAMAACGCRRIVVESSVSVGDSYGTARWGAGFIIRWALRQVMADKALQEAAVRASACDWTLLRPVRLTHAPAKGGLKAGTDLRWSIASTATRADVAHYMVQVLTDRDSYRKAFTLRH